MTLTVLAVARPLNPPYTVALDPDHLPAPAAAAFKTVIAARAAEHQAQQAADTSRDPADLDKLTAARASTDQAVGDLAEVTASSGTAIVDSATAAYVRALGRAHAALQTALDDVVEARHALALRRRVQPGRPVVNVNLESRGLRELPQWHQLSAAQGRIREAMADLVAADLT